MKRDESLRDVREAFASDADEEEEKKQATSSSSSIRPASLNAFDIISRSSSFDLSGLFEGENGRRAEARFATQKPTEAIVSKLEEIARTERFRVEKKDGVVKLEGSHEGGAAGGGGRDLRGHAGAVRGGGEEGGRRHAGVPAILRPGPETFAEGHRVGMANGGSVAAASAAALGASTTVAAIVGSCKA
ncbi:cbl-interacting protein kinase [Musa troglodytarum]|uniref:Cbl-interacting protein kinase n=1 Tax=Musa troglodytarum TaxID=320322 RepID=A0A9E7L137_9LILI|nr:cbl-interacting protein kinase [Musa troglodytarum]